MSHYQYKLDNTKKVDRPQFCEHCAGTEPWAREEWLVIGRLIFCCQWCADMYYESVLRVQIRFNLKRGRIVKKHD